MTDEKLDKWLERALNEYSQVEPRTGIEQRILAGVDIRAHSHRHSWWWLAVPALAALAIVAVVLSVSSHQPEKQVTQVQRSGSSAPSIVAKGSAASTQAPVTASQRRATRLSHTARKEQSPQDPRLNTFPSRSEDDQLVQLAMRFVQAQPTMAAQITQEQNDFRQVAEAFTAPLQESSQPKFPEER